VIRQKKIKKSVAAGTGDGYSGKLFSFLRNERQRLAQQAGVPPFVIFSDRTLREMALYFPDTDEKMMNISGVGQAKLEKYGDSFMTIIEMYKHMHPDEAERHALVQPPVSVRVKKRSR
jgi:ATP-dependent DNA helicase RecQ